MSKKTSTILITIAAILIAVSTFLLGGILLSKYDENSKKNDTEEELSSSVDFAYTVKYDGFKFTIPSELVYTAETNSLILEDINNTWISYLEVIEGQYNKLLTNKNQLASLYEEQGYKTSSAINKTIGRTSFITLEMSKAGDNALLAISNANNNYMFGIVITNQNNDYAYNVLGILSDIINKAEYLGNTVSIQGNEVIDMNIISNLAK